MRCRKWMGTMRYASFLKAKSIKLEDGIARDILERTENGVGDSLLSRS